MAIPFVPSAVDVVVLSKRVRGAGQAENRETKDRKRQQSESCGAICIKIECALQGISPKLIVALYRNCSANDRFKY